MGGRLFEDLFSDASAARRTWRLALSLGLLVVTFGVFPSPGNSQGAKGKVEPPTGVSSPSVSAAGDDEYVIGPGDVLHVFVWKEPELTREVPVRLDGKITVPLVGDVEAAGRTPNQLGADLTQKLGRYVEAPLVTVGIAQANSSRFFVVGQVARPGEQPLKGRTTLLQALALAGGLREFAKADSIVIIREEKGRQKTIPVNYKKLESGKDASQNVVLRPGDTIVVP